MSIAKAYIFDLDGTLLDSCEQIVNAKLKVLEAMNIDAPDRDHLSSMNGMAIEDTFILSTGIEDIAVRNEACRMYHPLFLKLTEENLRLFPDVIPTLRALRAGGALVGVTSMRLPEHLDTIMRLSGLADEVDGWISEVEAGAAKPSPAMVNRLLDKFGVHPADTVIVGDTVYDLEMASYAGCRAVGFTLGAQSARMLSTRAPQALIDNFSALLTL